MSETLAPCPFCGGNAELQWYAHPNVTRFYWVACTQCQADTPLQGIDTSNQEAVIEFWNRRAESADHAALVERVKVLEATNSKLSDGLCDVLGQRDDLQARIAELENNLRMVGTLYQAAIDDNDALKAQLDPDALTAAYLRGVSDGKAKATRWEPMTGYIGMRLGCGHDIWITAETIDGLAFPDNIRLCRVAGEGGNE